MGTKAKTQRARNPKVAKGDDAVARFDNMSECVKKGFEKLFTLEGHFAKAYQNGLHGGKSCAKIDEEIKKVKADLKNDTGGDWKDIKPWYDIYSREQDAEKEMEDEDRERVLNTHRIMFRSLDKGEMVNFLDIIGNKNWTPPLVSEQKADEDALDDDEKRESAAAGSDAIN